MSRAGPDPEGKDGLDRALTLAPLILYGMGVIVGAGIYVALGAVMQRAGAAAPLSFFLAGASAALTGLCYAEPASRFPVETFTRRPVIATLAAAQSCRRRRRLPYLASC